MKRHPTHTSDPQNGAASKRRRYTHTQPSPDVPSPAPAAAEATAPEPVPDRPPSSQQQQNSHSTKPQKPPPPSFTEADSLRKQAEPYRLAIAELPINLLNSSWSRGNNRTLDRNHVAHLCRSFRQGNLARRAEENYIQVSCSAAAVDNIIASIPEIDHHPDGTIKDYVLSFRHWADINDERPEVMAGQHRIEALRNYVKQTGSDTDDLWWVCEFYDKGAS
jgi:hypothetical protein